MSGCLIVTLVCAGLAIPVAGIVAAIAIPAYQDYMIRSRVTAASMIAMRLRDAIQSGLAEDGVCPANGSPGIGEPSSFAGKDIAPIDVGTFDGGRCGYAIVMADAGNSALDEKTLRWELDSSADVPAWRCSSDLAGKWLPAACRTR